MMPVARSVSATQLQRDGGSLSSVTTPVGEDIADQFQQRAHTLDRYLQPSLNDYGENRRKRTFMSFRLIKKATKSKERSDVSNDILDNSLCTMVENGSDYNEIEYNSSSAKTTRKYLNRVSSFMNRVTNRVQNSNNNPGASSKVKLERSFNVMPSSDFSAFRYEDYVQYDSPKVPGVIGIQNHGNTCFINAVIQCLNHTDILAEYFVFDQYKHDLARCNRINSRKYGTKGEITEHLALLIKALWTLKYAPDISSNFKSIVEKYESSYRGSNQHDAAEFLMFVLDKVHEDLNTASKKKYKKIKNSYGRPDEVVAAETLANHLRCNSSFVHDLFQAQFRSSLKCPHCQRESNTFDPFLCVSIPIPQKIILSIFVTVVYLNQQPKQVQLGISIETSKSIQHLRHQLANDCGIDAENLILTELDGEGFHRTFSDNSNVAVISSNDPIYAVEVASYKPPSEENGVFLLLIWINVLKSEAGNIRFAGVYQTQVARDILYTDLQKLLLKEMMSMVTNDTLVSEQEVGLFEICVDDGGSCLVPLDPKLDVPLYHESIEQALALCNGQPSAGPPHLKLVLKWLPEPKKQYIVDDIDHVDEHFSVQQLRQNPPICAPVSLSECFQLHTSAEKLSSGDAWHCPTCDRKQQVVKRLMLWSAPQILVLHLKRFRQGSRSSSKLTTLVQFPFVGLDISEHVASRGNTGDLIGNVWSPWKRQKQLHSGPDGHFYDLYAVCNHHGQDLQGGHYTAFCLNPANSKWYSFDDSSVSEIDEADVITEDAYLLFYQRHDVSMRQNTCSSNGNSNHWAYRIPRNILPSTLGPPESGKTESAPVQKEFEVSGEKLMSTQPSPLERGQSYGTLPLNSSPMDSCEKDHSSDTEATITTQEEMPVDIPDSKTVLINESIFKKASDNSCCHEDASCQPVHELAVSQEELCETPEVRIRPATPEVFAAHRTGGPIKRNTVVLTMRPKVPEPITEAESPPKERAPSSSRYSANRTPSFVVLRTPTASPRPTRTSSKLRDGIGSTNAVTRECGEPRHEQWKQSDGEQVISS